MKRQLRAVPASFSILRRQPACPKPAPGLQDISVHHLEHRDGRPIVYVDAGDVVVFIYIGHPAMAGTTTGTPAGSTSAGDLLEGIVLDVHRRNRAGEQRLHLLLDEAPTGPSMLDPARSQVLGVTEPRHEGVDLVCVHCGTQVTAGATGFLHVLLAAAAAHACPPATGGTRCG
jgi:hypothetical protein